MSGLHADALATLRRWRPPSPEQSRLRDRYVGHLEAHPDATTRDCRPDHVTASTLVVSADGRQVLLTLHAKSGRWFQLGGHTEPGDQTLAAAALREAVEESGLTDLDLDPVPVVLDAHPVPFCWPGHGVHHLDVMFVARAAAGAEPSASEESLDLAWWPVDDLPDPELEPFVRLACQRVAVTGVPARPSGR